MKLRDLSDKQLAAKLTEAFGQMVKAHDGRGEWPKVGPLMRECQRRGWIDKQGEPQAQVKWRLRKRAT